VAFFSAKLKVLAETSFRGATLSEAFFYHFHGCCWRKHCDILKSTEGVSSFVTTMMQSTFLTYFSHLGCTTIFLSSFRVQPFARHNIMSNDITMMTEKWASFILYFHVDGKTLPLNENFIKYPLRQININQNARIVAKGPITSRCIKRDRSTQGTNNFFRCLFTPIFPWKRNKPYPYRSMFLFL